MEALPQWLSLLLLTDGAITPVPLVVVEIDVDRIGQRHAEWYTHMRLGGIGA